MNEQPKSHPDPHKAFKEFDEAGRFKGWTHFEVWLHGVLWGDSNPMPKRDRVSGEPPKPDKTSFDNAVYLKGYYTQKQLLSFIDTVSGEAKTPENDEYKDWGTKNPTINKFLFDNHRHDDNGAIIYDEDAVLKLVSLCGAQ